jgi:hypothetical protein
MIRIEKLQTQCSRAETEARYRKGGVSFTTDLIVLGKINHRQYPCDQSKNKASHIHQSFHITASLQNWKFIFLLSLIIPHIQGNVTGVICVAAWSAIWPEPAHYLAY